MSTANFSIPNTTAHFTIPCEDEFEYNDTKDNIGEDLSGKFRRLYEADKWLSRYRHAFGEIFVEIYNKEYRFWEDVSIYIVAESGHYSGAMFDYELDFELEDLPKYKQAEVARILAKIESVFADYCNKLNRIATLSNGEAIYQSVS